MPSAKTGRMHERSTPPPSGGTDTPEALRVQILATEHWSLLATRSMTYGEVFSRASIFLTVVSASVVALALVAQATDFGDGFYVFALLVLPVVLFIGVATYVRLIDTQIEDAWLVFGMNRLRHAYIEIAPELEPYFVTGLYDDEQGLFETYGPGADIRLSRLLASTSVLVGMIVAALAGVVGGLVAKAVDSGSVASVFVGATVTAVMVVLLVLSSRRIIERIRTLLAPRFARSGEDDRGQRGRDSAAV